MRRLTVIIPTHNPHPRRFMRTLEGLMKQSVDPEIWELLIVDNASALPIELPEDPNLRSRVRLVRESRLGLTFARRAGINEALGEIVVFVDDDNVLAPDYLEKVLSAFARLPRAGAIGGKSIAEFEAEPVGWQQEFLPLLAVRDLGDKELLAFPPAAGGQLHEYPACAPIGAGMAVRRVALSGWLSHDSEKLADRRGDDLSSAGDNELILYVLAAGWAVAYVPELTLTHLIPARRLEPDYLARLNHGIQKSWTQVLARHGVSPWAPLPRWTVPLRCAKAWFQQRAWRDPASRIRWQGACGHFQGRATAQLPPSKA
jgi:glycosyltransferase involved in cell wall biosynthesis